MSHHFPGEHSYFNYNSDLSGLVRISQKGTERFIEIPAGDLIQFVARIKRDQMLSEIEDETAGGLLGLRGIEGIDE